MFWSITWFPSLLILHFMLPNAMQAIYRIRNRSRGILPILRQIYIPKLYHDCARELIEYHYGYIIGQHRASLMLNKRYATHGRWRHWLVHCIHKDMKIITKSSNHMEAVCIIKVHSPRSTFSLIVVVRGGQVKWRKYLWRASQQSIQTI